MDLLTVVGFCANIVSIVFYIAPTMIIVDLFRTKDTSRVPWLLFCGTIGNCLFFTIYGLQKGPTFWAVYLNNGIGCALNLIYLVIFILFLEQHNLAVRISFSIFLVAGCATIMASFLLIIKNSNITGSIAMVFNFLMFFTSLQKIFDVFQYKDNSYIPMFTIVSLLCSSFLWMSYGFLQSVNIYLIAPNMLGFVISLFQVVLWFVYNNPNAEEKKQISTEQNIDHESTQDQLICKESDQENQVLIKNKH